MGLVFEIVSFAVPITASALAAFLGAAQVRAFGKKTGDNSLIIRLLSGDLFRRGRGSDHHKHTAHL